MRKAIPAVLLLTLLLPAMLFAAEGKFDRTLTVSGPVNLDVNTGSGEIVIKTGSGNQVVIHGVVRSSNNWFSGDSESAVRSVESNPPIQQNGNDIRIGANLPEDAKRRVSISYEITVPPDTSVKGNSGSGNIGVEGVRRGVTVNTGSGDVRLRDLGPQIEAHTGSGSIRAQDVAAPFTAKTGSGDIEASLTGSGDVEVQTGSGSVKLQGVKGGLRGRTGSGDINADGDVKGSWSLHTGSGGVHIAAGSSGFNLNAHTGSGSIHSDLPITMQGTLNRHELKGSIRGGGPDVEVSTGSGDITLH